MKLKIKLLLLACAVFMIAALTACAVKLPDNNNPDVNTDNGTPPDEDDAPTDGTDNTDTSGICLVDCGVASFRFVTTSDISASAVRRVDKLITELRSLGVEIQDRVSDSKASDITECEVIVGTSARGRGEECNISPRDLGIRGYIIKAVGNRIVVAGGTPEKTDEALAVFAEKYLGITESTEGNISSLYVAQDLLHYVPTEYKVESVAIGENDLSKYSIFIDTASRATDHEISVLDIQNGLYISTGYWLDVADINDIENYRYRIILRYVEYAGDDGFRIFTEGNDLIVESAYINSLTDSFENFLRTNVFELGYDVIIPADIYYTEHVSTVHYKDFGAVGDGNTDDYDAILHAHEYANIGGQKVYADEGAVYYVNVFTKAIPVRTDVDFGNAKFIIDDRGSDVYGNRGLGLFNIIRDNSAVELKAAAIAQIAQTYDITITLETTELPWLAPYLSTDSLVRFYNASHKDFIRYGSNEDKGYDRQDIMLVSKDGKISADTLPAYKFDEYSSIFIYSTDDAPITVSGGYFETVCCLTVAETDYINKWCGYQRGIVVNRSNVTLENIVHTVTGEPQASPYSYDEDRKESYPYYGFIYISSSYDVLVKNCSLVGHTVYYEDKPATTSSEAKPVSMGTYDFVIEHSSHVTFENVTQTNSITDTTYWGIMSSNGAKNMTFDSCYISRFDAHRGFFNATVTDTKIGRTFNVIGGGYLNVSNTVRLAGNSFITLRSDYGATFRGDITLVNCTLENYYEHTGGELSTDRRSSSSSYLINSGYNSQQNLYLNWDFGYTCYMPINVTVDNFKWNGSGKAYLFNNIHDNAFSTEYLNTYMITQSITYRNMNKLPTCSSSLCTKLNGIPVTVK